MTEVASLRKPYPFPTLENDNTYNGVQSVERPDYLEPTHIDQSKDPWNRLNNKHTLSSTRHQVYSFDPQVPSDNLDFLLKTEYNHHTDLFKAKNEAYVQAETLGLDHGRVLKNRFQEMKKENPALNHPIRLYHVDKRESPYSIKKAIEGVHSQATNKGYSRKPDGGFFTS